MSIQQIGEEMLRWVLSTDFNYNRERELMPVVIHSAAPKYGRYLRQNQALGGVFYALYQNSG